MEEKQGQDLYLPLVVFQVVIDLKWRNLLPALMNSSSVQKRNTRNKKDVQKKKTDGVTEWLQQYEERQFEFQRNKMEKIKEMHDEKMQMMGKLLNALEKKNMWIEASLYISW